MGELKNGNGTVHTSALPDEAVYGAPKSNISLTQIDEGDMYRLGKTQELNVWTCPQLQWRRAHPADLSSATSASFPSWDFQLF